METSQCIHRTLKCSRILKAGTVIIHWGDCLLCEGFRIFHSIILYQIQQLGVEQDKVFTRVDFIFVYRFQLIVKYYTVLGLIIFDF